MPLIVVFGHNSQTSYLNKKIEIEKSISNLRFEMGCKQSSVVYKVNENSLSSFKIYPYTKATYNGKDVKLASQNIFFVYPNIYIEFVFVREEVKYTFETKCVLNQYPIGKVARTRFKINDDYHQGIVRFRDHLEIKNIFEPVDEFLEFDIYSYFKGYATINNLKLFR